MGFLILLPILVALIFLFRIASSGGRVLFVVLIALSILSDLAPKIGAIYAVKSLRRDELPEPVSVVAVRENDLDLRGIERARVGSGSWRDLYSTMDHGKIDSFYYLLKNSIDENNGLVDEKKIHFDAGDFKRYIFIKDDGCSGPDRILFRSHAIEDEAPKPVRIEGRKCLQFSSAQPDLTKVPRFVTLAPPKKDLHWPLVSATVRAFVLPNGRAKARACGSYEGGFWMWVDEVISSTSFLNASGVSHKKRHHLGSYCDEPLLWR